MRQFTDGADDDGLDRHDDRDRIATITAGGAGAIAVPDHAVTGAGASAHAGTNAGTDTSANTGACVADVRGVR